MALKQPTRVSVKLKTPNPLFERWLSEWRDKAKENSSKMEHCFSIALKSLRKYPLPLDTGRDCKLLHGFGDKLCKMLDEKLSNYCANEPVIPNAAIKPVASPQPAAKRKKNNSSSASTSSTSSKDYVPQHGSGAYAILVTLYQKSLEPNYVGHLTKIELIRHGQHHCTTSFTKPQPGTRYTAWSAMRGLLEKDLLTKRGNPARFSLTDSGIVLAHKLWRTAQQHVDDPDIICGGGASTSADTGVNSLHSQRNEKLMPTQTSRAVDSVGSTASTSAVEECVILAPNTFDIILLVDLQETAGTKTNPDDDVLLSELRNLHVPSETKHLKVGDYTWICRDSVTKLELVLPYIVERKRMDDFAMSIKDGRFHEQKFRLKQCGLQNIIYLVERYGTMSGCRNDHLGLPISTLYQAATNTLVQDGFTVKFTDNIRGTAEYLACMTTLIRQNYQQKTMVSCPKDNIVPASIHDELIALMTFTEFNKNASKNKHLKVKEMFIRQLLQIKGISVDKAIAIVDKYNTPKALKLAYDASPESQREIMLAKIQYGATRKNIGPILSKIVHELFVNKSFRM